MSRVFRLVGLLHYDVVNCPRNWPQRVSHSHKAANVRDFLNAYANKSETSAIRRVLCTRVIYITCAGPGFCRSPALHITLISLHPYEVAISGKRGPLPPCTPERCHTNFKTAHPESSLTYKTSSDAHSSRVTCVTSGHFQRSRVAFPVG